MFGWIFGETNKETNDPLVVHYGEKFAIRRSFCGEYEYLDAKDKNYWWIDREGIERYAMFNNLAEAKAALSVATKHNTPVEI